VTASPVSICSNALLMLGDSPIASFDDASDRARQAANLFPTARDYVLRLHPWNCAVKRVLLSPEATPPAFEWAAAFTLPDDHLRTLSVGERQERVEYAQEGRQILMRSNVCRLRYIFRNEAVPTWDSSLIWAMTTAMRALFAYGTTQSTSLEQVINESLREVLRQARAADGQEQEMEPLDDSPLLDARFIQAGSGRYRGGW